MRYTGSFDLEIFRKASNGTIEWQSECLLYWPAGGHEQFPSGWLVVDLSFLQESWHNSGIASSSSPHHAPNSSSRLPSHNRTAFGSAVRVRLCSFVEGSGYDSPVLPPPRATWAHSFVILEEGAATDATKMQQTAITNANVNATSCVCTLLVAEGSFWTTIIVLGLVAPFDPTWAVLSQNGYGPLVRKSYGDSRHEF